MTISAFFSSHPMANLQDALHSNWPCCFALICWINWWQKIKTCFSDDPLTRWFIYIPIPLAPGLCKSICNWWFALPSSSAPLAAPSAPDRSAKLGGTQWPQARSEWSQGSGENETGAEPLRNSRKPASRRPRRDRTAARSQEFRELSGVFEQETPGWEEHIYPNQA